MDVTDSQPINRKVAIMSGASHQLTSRESEVLDLLLMGLADKEVAKTLGSATRRSGRTSPTPCSSSALLTAASSVTGSPRGDAGESGSRAVGQSGSRAVTELGALLSSA